MKSQALQPLLTALRRPVDDRRLSDRQLLQGYLDRGDELAFAALVRRHGPRVRAACRQVLSDEADVDDAFQTTFLVLLDKARSMRWRPSLGGWLFGVAHRVALRARARAAARQRHESRAIRSVSCPEADLSWREAVAVLHEELDRLPDRLRLPLLLCYLEGLSRDEAALQLGWTPGTVRGCLERGRNRLRGRLSRRGITLTAGLLAVLGNSSAACTVPPRLFQTTVQAAARRALPTPVLPHGVPPIMWKSYTGLLAGLLLVALAVGGGFLLTPPGANATGVAPAADRPPATKAPPQTGRPASESITVAGRVLDPDSKPMAGVGIYLGRDSTGAISPVRRSISDKDGRFQLRLDPAAFVKAHGRADAWRNARVVAVADGFGPAWALAGRATEGELILRLVADMPLDGRILTLEGRPVAGARLRLQSLSAWESEAELSAHLRAVASGDAQPRPFGWLDEVPGRNSEWKTDDRGRVRITGLGRDRIALLEVTGPGIAHDTILVVTRAGKPVIGRPGPYWEAPTIYPAMFEHTAKPGRVLTGKAVDAATGRSVAGIKVQSAGAPPQTVTDAEGGYELTGLPKASKYILYAQPARGDVPYLAVRLDVTDTTGVGPLRTDLRIPRGIPLRVRVSDPETGKNMRAGVYYVPLYPNRNAPENLMSLMLGTNLEPDDSYRGAVLPGPGAICVTCSGGDYLPAAVNQKTFFRLDRVPGDEKILPASEVLWTSAPNPNPLPQRQFQVIQFIDPPADAKEVSLTLKPDAGKSATIRLQDVDGRALTGVRVWDWRRGEEWGPPLASAGLKVSGLGPGRPRYLVFRHEGRKLAGTVIVKGDETRPVSVALRPWGTATGRLVDAGGKPLPRHELRGRNPPKGHDNALTLPGAVRTDDEGKFRLEGLVPGGNYYLMASKYLSQVGDFIGVGYLTAPVTVGPGETKDLGDVPVRRGAPLNR
jgi:RNA polymerase sigma factor (sigma-70 family)